MINELMTHLWQSTLFAVAAGLLTLAFRENRARVRFGLWLSASLKFFIPFALLMNLGSHMEWSPAAHRIATQIATPAVSFAVEYAAEPFLDALSSTPSAPLHFDWMPIALLAGWACGFLAIALMRLRLWLRIRVAVNDSTPLQIPAAVAIRSSSGLLEPGVVGLLNPVLLLPEGIEERLTPSQLETVLAHELCHVRRRDNLFAALHMLVEAIFWFHPLVWWIGARLVEERERACDEEVLSLGNQPRIYADAILNVYRLYTESPLVCVSGVTGADVRRRIEAIMINRTSQTLNRAKKILLASAGFAALAGPVAIGIVIGLGHIPEIHAQSPAAVPPMVQLTAPTLAQTIPAPTLAPAPLPAPPPTQSEDRRLVVMYFDCDAMTADEQSRARQAGVNFVQKNLMPADLVAVIAYVDGKPDVEQDFTADTTALEATIQRVSATSGNGAVAGSEASLAHIGQVAGMLRAIAGKKVLIYFSAGVSRTEMESEAQRHAVINLAQNSNMSIFPIDVRRIAAPEVASGLSPEEYNRRLAYAQTKFGTATSAMARTYIRYGAPDQIDGQIWRYNYLDDFHGPAAFEFTGNGPLGARVIFPAPEGTFQGRFGVTPPLAALAEANAVAELPGGHATVQINPIFPGMTPSPERKFARLLVPLESLSGQVDIIAHVNDPGTGAPGPVVASVQNSVPAAAGSFQAIFTLKPGAYSLSVLVHERETGHVFGETVNFDVQ